MPEYRLSDKERDMCDSLAQVWALAENEELHFKDVNDAKKPEVISELIQRQREISSWFYDVASKNENRQASWEHLQEVGGTCRAYLAKMQDVKRIEAENLIYAGSQPGSVRSASRLIRGSSRAKVRSDEFVGAFVNMVDQANQYGMIGAEDEIRIQNNLQAYRKAIVHKTRKLEDLPRPFRAAQDEMDAFAGEFDPSIEQEMERLENQVKEPEKGVIPPVPEGPGPIRVEDVLDDNYQRQREARERVQVEHAREEEAIRQENARLKAEAERIKAEHEREVQHQREEEAIRAENARLKAEAERIRAEHERDVQHQREEEAVRAENARLKAEAERIRAEHERAEREKWVQHEKEEEELRAMNERLKAQAVRIKNEHERAERAKQAQAQKAEPEHSAQPQPQKVEAERQAQPQKEKEVPAGAESKDSKEKKKGLQIEAQESFTYHAVRAPHMQAVEGLMSRLQYSEQILRNIAMRLEWMQMNPMGYMPYAPLMNSFQRSLAVPVFQNLMQYQNMPGYRNMAQYQNMPGYQNMAQYQNIPQNQNMPWQTAPQNASAAYRGTTGPQMAYRAPQMNYGNPMNPQISQPAFAQRAQMSQPVQNQNLYMYSQPMPNVMYDSFGMNRQQDQMQMAYMLQNMSLIRLALTYASISIMETYNQIKDWLSEWGKEKNIASEQKMPSASKVNEREKTASDSSEKRPVSFRDLEARENAAIGRESQKKIPLTMEREPLTRQKEKGMTMH